MTSLGNLPPVSFADVSIFRRIICSVKDFSTVLETTINQGTTHEFLLFTHNKWKKQRAYTNPPISHNPSTAKAVPLLTGARTLCHFVTSPCWRPPLLSPVATFPHAVGNHPALQGVTLYTREALKVRIYAVFNVTNQSEIPALLLIRAKRNG